MMTVEEYIESFGFKPEDLTPEEMKEVKEEVKAINAGETILDGVLSFKI